MRRTNMTVAGLVAGGALLLALPGASLASGHTNAATKTAHQATAQRGLLLGSLGSLTASSAVVNIAGGSPTTVSVGAYTRYIAHTQAAAIAGLKSGEQVAVRTVTTAAGVKAGAIEYDTVAFGVPARVVGTITGGTPGSTLTITPASGAPVTVQLNTSTKYVVNGTRVSGLTSIPTNQVAMVSALQMTTGGTVASTVSIGQAPAKGQRVVVRGTVASIAGNVITVTVKKNATPVQVQLAPTTSYIVGGKMAPAAPSFTTKERIVIVATRQSDGSLVATTVAVA